MLPKIPKRPEIKLPTNPLNPIKDVIRGSRERIKEVSGNIRSISEEIRGFSLTEPQARATAPVVEEKASYGVSDRDTLLYQLDHLFQPLRQLEYHLSEGCRILGTPCDCCQKSGSDIRIFANEAISIAARMGKETSIYQDIAKWASHIEEIGTPEKVESGKYDETYRRESGTASKFRKKAQSMISEFKKEDESCPGCEEMRESIGRFIEKKKKERERV